MEAQGLATSIKIFKSKLGLGVLLSPRVSRLLYFWGLIYLYYFCVSSVIHLKNIVKKFYLIFYFIVKVVWDICHTVKWRRPYAFISKVKKHRLKVTMTCLRSHSPLTTRYSLWETKCKTRPKSAFLTTPGTLPLPLFLKEIDVWIKCNLTIWNRPY